MKRLSFLSPDVEHAGGVVALLKAHSVPERHIYLLARHDIPLEGLPDAGPEGDDFMPAYKRGLAYGGTAGLLGGLFALAFPPAGLTIGGGAVLLTTLYGAGAGAFLGGIGGGAFPSSRLTEYEASIDAGRILVLVDVPTGRADDIQSLIRNADPAVEILGTTPPAPAIPGG